MISREGGGVALREKKEAWEGHELLRRVHTPTFTHTPVTFDTVVVQYFCHGGQSLVPHVTLGDQLEETYNEECYLHTIILSQDSCDCNNRLSWLLIFMHRYIHSSIFLTYHV